MRWTEYIVLSVISTENVKTLKYPTFLIKLFKIWRNNEEEPQKGFYSFEFIEQLLILISTVTGCVPISLFMSSTVEIKICIITAGIKN